MRETTFKTEIILPTETRWHLRTGDGHLYIVSEDPTYPAFVFMDGRLHTCVDWKTSDAPLIQPKVDA